MLLKEDGIYLPVLVRRFSLVEDIFSLMNVICAVEALQMYPFYSLLSGAFVEPAMKHITNLNESVAQDQQTIGHHTPPMVTPCCHYITVFLHELGKEYANSITTHRNSWGVRFNTK
ncbi:hypothetical protein AB4K20DRAFT_1866901 [Rhizopus microsporus]